MKLTKNVHSLDDMLAIDEAVLEILEKNWKFSWQMKNFLL
jgi:hypothetical protein